MTRILFLIAIILVTNACTPNIVNTPLPLPPKPYIARITDADLMCLADPVYQRLAQRDLALRHYQKRLEAVIKSTWDKSIGNKK